MLPEPGPIARRAPAEALANVGVTEEGGNNRGRFVQIYQKAVGINPGDPWCAAFCRYRLENAAEDLSLTIPADFPDSGWTPDYKTWAKEKGLWIPAGSAKGIIRTGDLCCFYFAAKGRIAHIGIVVEPRTNGFVSVEGNTSPDSGEVVQRDGDGVFRKTRSYASLGTYGGFVRCPF